MQKQNINDDLSYDYNQILNVKAPYSQIDSHIDFDIFSENFKKESKRYSLSLEMSLN